MSTFLLRSPVDWSLLTNGFHISTEFHPLVNAMPVIEYIKNQKEHHKKMTFEEEYIQFLKLYNVEYDERYVFAD